MIIAFVTMSLWDEPWRGRHHYANLLAKKHTVVWINRNLRNGENGPERGLVHVRDGLHVLHSGPELVPRRADWRVNLNNRLRLGLFERELAKIGHPAGPDFVWIYDYRAGVFARRYRSRAKSIYFCNDYFGESAYARYEQGLARNVDAVFCTAPPLKTRLETFNPKTFFLPHGVDIPEVRPTYRKNDRPVTAGYVGTLRNSVDFEFLRRIVDETDIRLVLAGPVIECTDAKRNEIERLFEHERVEYRGNLDREAAFRTMDELDLGLLPYERTIAKRHAFVIKFLEYLVLGKPILATPYFEWPEPYASFVSVANGHGTLSEACDRAYGSWTEDRFRRAIELARASTWQRRVETIAGHVGVEL